MVLFLWLTIFEPGIRIRKIVTKCFLVCSMAQIWQSTFGDRAEIKGMTFDHDFGYSFTLLSFLLKKEGRRKGEWSSKNCDKKSCLSARSFSEYYHQKTFKIYLFSKWICSQGIWICRLTDPNPRFEPKDILKYINI